MLQKIFCEAYQITRRIFFLWVSLCGKFFYYDYSVFFLILFYPESTYSFFMEDNSSSNYNITTSHLVKVLNALVILQCSNPLGLLKLIFFSSVIIIFLHSPPPPQIQTSFVVNYKWSSELHWKSSEVVCILNIFECVAFCRIPYTFQKLIIPASPDINFSVTAGV